jgi:LPS export ABC transporter permease LptG
MRIVGLYLLRQLGLVFAFAIGALCIIFVVVNAIEKLDDFLDSATPASVILEYYVVFLPEMLKYVTPVATLLACLFGIGRLTQRHELTAMKAAGIGLRNILAIVLPVALCLSLLQFLFNGWVVPKATERKLAIERRYLQQLALQGPLFNLYFRDAPQRTVVLQRYDPEQRQAAIVLIEEYRTANAPHLLRRWEAQQMFWDSLRQVWRARQVIERTYEGDQVRVQSFPERDFALRLRHEHLLQLQRSPAEMPLPELRRFIATLRAGGQDVYALETNYFAEFALPFAHFVVALFAVPLASVYRRSGLAAQFSAAAVIVFVYMVFARVSQIVGATALLPAPLAGWSANIVFLVAGVITAWRTRT